MLLEEIRNIKSEKKDLRNFGITFGVAFALLGGALWWKGRDTYSAFLALSALFIFSGFVFPRVLKPLQKAWMTLAVILGYFMTRIILSILFYLVFTIIGLSSRIVGRQFLNLKNDPSKETYWIKRDKVPFDRKNYERQF